MMRGPTSSVTISSASPLLILRLCFQPLYSTSSTVTPFLGSAARAGRHRKSTQARAAPTGSALRNERERFTGCVLGVWGIVGPLHQEPASSAVSLSELLA